MSFNISPSEKLRIASARRILARIRVNKYIDENYQNMDKDLLNIIQYYLGATDLRDETLKELEQDKSDTKI